MFVSGMKITMLWKLKSCRITEAFDSTMMSWNQCPLTYISTPKPESNIRVLFPSPQDHIVQKHVKAGVLGRHIVLWPTSIYNSSTIPTNLEGNFNFQNPKCRTGPCRNQPFFHQSVKSMRFRRQRSSKNRMYISKSFLKHSRWAPTSRLK